MRGEAAEIILLVHQSKQWGLEGRVKGKRS